MVDFFVSYTSADRTWAEWIAWNLEAGGYSLRIQAWDFRPGENFVLAMHQAANEARRTLIVLSPAYLESRFTKPEWAAAFAQDPTGKRLVPVRVQECAPAGLLGPIVYIDLVGLSEEAARAALLDGVREGRQKPAVAPRFPTASPTTPSFPGAPPEAQARPTTASDPVSPPESQPAPSVESDEDVLRSIQARHLVQLNTIDLDYDLARAVHDRADIEGIVDDAETLLRSVDPTIDGRAAVFGVQNLPSPPATPQRIWKAILMEAPLKSPRALAAILLRAKRVSGTALPRLDAVLAALVAESPGKGGRSARSRSKPSA